MVVLAPASFYLEEAFEALNFHHDRQVYPSKLVKAEQILIFLSTGTLCPWLSGVGMPGDGFLPAWGQTEAR